MYDEAYFLLASLDPISAARLLNDPTALRDLLDTYRLDLDESELAELRAAFRA